MAVNRQVNLLGQQRIDVPHVRSLESAVCYDFDAVGLMVTGGIPSVISGFDVSNYTTIVGTLASNLIINTASSRIVHPLASDSGSFFQVPSNRAAETINDNNDRVQGAWIAGTTNYIGVDLLRSADSTTATTVRFLTTNPDTETSKYVPLARTMDYKITISTVPFSVTPSICPLYIIVTDNSNTITAITDARTLLFSSFSGGDSPSFNNPFGWPGGRGRPTGVTALTAGDKSIRSLSQWRDAITTRLQEVGGGEYWYSLTADRNVRMVQGAPFFSSNGESLEWVSSNLHWKNIKFLFDNSTSWVNEVADQTTSSAGLTDLAEGECIYVDLDRGANHTVTGNNPLVAQKGILASLGGSAVPGQRWVIASRYNNEIFVKDQSYPVGSAFSVATVSHAGAIRTTINANGDISDPIAVGLGDSATALYTATCGGISHNRDLSVSTIVAVGDIVIGRGIDAGDESVILYTEGSNKTSIIGSGGVGFPIASIEKLGGNDPNSTILKLDEVCKFTGTRAWSLNTITVLPLPPIANSATSGCIQYFAKQTKTWKASCRAVLTSVGGDNWVYDPDTYTLQNLSSTTQLNVDGELVEAQDRILINTLNQSYNGIYVVDDPGGSGQHPTLIRSIDAGGPGSATDLEVGYDLFDGVSVFVEQGEIYGSTYFTLNALAKSQSVFYDENIVYTWTESDAVTADQLCVMFMDGSYTVIASGPDYLVGLS